jgi:hypothetical protein
MLSTVGSLPGVCIVCGLLCLSVLPFTRPAFASDGGATGTIHAPHLVPAIQEQIRVDGVLDESVWQEALRLELNYEVRPGENIPPPTRTEVLLAHDPAHLYAAFRCYDPDPSAIRARYSDRDALDNEEDWVGIVLDTFNDQRRAYDFLVNPLGVQEDFVEAETGGGESWDAIWDSAGRITEWGYAVELSVPFDQLRFQRTGSEQVWGFDAVRRYPRRLRHHIGTFPRDRSNNCYLCQAIKIRGFEGVSPGNNIEISPTLTTIRTDMRNDLPSGPLEREKQEADPGLTARWGLTTNLTFGATLNPDFSQVEADALQLDINQPFDLYYSERRPFFTEGADFFRTLKRAIYTRTMHDPSWGLKLTGKEGQNTVGVYVVRDEVTNLIFPGSEGSRSTSLPRESAASVLRYKRDIGSHYTIGVLGTYREGNDYYNEVVGFDGDFRVTPTNQIQIQVLGSRTHYPFDLAHDFDQPTGQMDDVFVAFEYDHVSRSAGWWLDYDYVGSDFRADLGYIPRVDFRNVEGGLNYRWNAEQGSWWERLMVGNEVNYYENQRGDLLEKGGSVWLWYEGFAGSDAYFEVGRVRETYNGREFEVTGFEVQGGFRPRPDLRVSIWTSFGDRIDYANTRPGERFALNPYIRYNPGRHLRLTLDHTYERLLVDGGRLYTANASQLTAVYHFTARAFFRSILQYVDYERNTDLYTFSIDPEYRRFFSQLLFSYKINPRTVFFLGYGDTHVGSHEYDLTQSDRTFFAKLGYAWVQ